jgi:hypothetical protein
MPAPYSKRARLTWLVLALGACSDARAGSVGQAAQDDSAGGWKIATIADFNADGLGDVLWSDPVRGRIAVFLLRGTSLIEAGPAIPGPAGRGWAAVTALDFNLDAMADVPWFDAARNRAAVWLMRGTHLAEPGREIAGPPGEGWVLSYSGDFNGDGMADLIWHDADNGRFVIYLMRGTQVIEVGPQTPGPPGDGWIVPTTGDFNLDGMFDIVWQNPRTNQMAVWLMRGTEVLERGPAIPGPPGRGWVIPTTGDFDGDGLADVLWNDPVTNRMAIWLMAGTHLREPGPEIPGPAGEGWSVGSAADTNGDGLADTVWQNTLTDRFSVWLMAGTHVFEAGPEIPGPP